MAKTKKAIAAKLRRAGVKPKAADAMAGRAARKAQKAKK